MSLSDSHVSTGSLFQILSCGSPPVAWAEKSDSFARSDGVRLWCVSIIALHDFNFHPWSCLIVLTQSLRVLWVHCLGHQLLDECLCLKGHWFTSYKLKQTDSVMFTWVLQSDHLTCADTINNFDSCNLLSHPNIKPMGVRKSPDVFIAIYRGSVTLLMLCTSVWVCPPGAYNNVLISKYKGIA